MGTIRLAPSWTASRPSPFKVIVKTEEENEQSPSLPLVRSTHRSNWDTTSFPLSPAAYSKGEDTTQRPPHSTGCEQDDIKPTFLESSQPKIHCLPVGHHSLSRRHKSPQGCHFISQCWSWEGEAGRSEGWKEKWLAFRKNDGGSGFNLFANFLIIRIHCLLRW